MAEIRVTVSGVGAAGKTTVAFAINKALRDLGLNVSMVDDNGSGVVCEPSDLVTETMERRVASLVKKRVKIKIRTINVIGSIEGM